MTAALVLLLGWAAAGAGTAGAQEVGHRWDCSRSWTVSTLAESEPFGVGRSPWALRWERLTPTHSPHDGLFAELYRVDDGAKTEDQAAAVNTDHEGHEGAVFVDETGRFWLHMESWSGETEWRLEVCVPPEEPAAAGGSAASGR